MKILIVSPAKPDRFKRVRLKHIIKALGEEYETGVIYSDKAKWKSFADCAFGLTTGKPLEICYCRDLGLSERVRREWAKYDLILVKRLRAVQYLPDEVSCPVIIDTTDAMSLFYERLSKRANGVKKRFYREESMRYLRYEKQVGERYKNWVACSGEDGEYLRRRIKGIRVWVVPNVVDTNFYRSRREGGKEKQILLSGLMEKQVNQEAVRFFMEKVYPLVARKVDGVRVNIVGPKPPRWMRGYENEGVSVLGKVRDLRSFIARAQVVAVPVLTGTGTSNKVLQAWSMGRAVVSTRVGVRGLEGKDGEELLIAEGEKEFAEAVVRLLLDRKLADRIGRKGRRLALRMYSLEVMRKKYNSVIGAVLRDDG